MTSEPKRPSRMGSWEDVDHEEWCPVDEEDGECECLRRLVIDARSWARHGYEIGQRSCTWSDQGVAPEWLTSDCAATAPRASSLDGQR